MPVRPPGETRDEVAKLVPLRATETAVPALDSPHLRNTLERIRDHSQKPM
jgi:hypothetical protein